MKITIISAFAVLASLAVGAPTVSVQPSAAINRHVCDRLVWADAGGRERTLAIAGPKDGEGLSGGYVVEATYFAGETRRVCKSTGGGLGGFGHLIMHGGHPRGWANSKEDALSVQPATILSGPHHALYQIKFRIATGAGPVDATVDYFVRAGRNDFIYAVTFDAGATKGLAADTRSPYVEFDWEGNGVYMEPISGMGWASANKRFRTTGDQVGPGCPWDWTADCTIPHIIEWKARDKGDAEIGLIQTQTFDQHDAGAGWWYQQGKSGTGLPENWNLTYQLNAYQGYNGKKATWMMPYGAVGGAQYDVFGNSRKASGFPFQSYSLLCVLDRFSDAGVEAAIAEMNTVQTAAHLTASVGHVATEGPAGVSRADVAPYAPAGWDPVFAAWTIACAGNAADAELTLDKGALPSPTFCFTGYTSPTAPTSCTLNGKPLVDGKDAFATVDRAEKRLFLTLGSTFQPGKHRVRIQGALNTAYPELADLVVAPGVSTQGVPTRLSIRVKAMDPDRNLRTVTADLSTLGGEAKQALTLDAKGVAACQWQIPANAEPGPKTIRVVATDADGHTDAASATCFIVAPPKAYAPGVYWDFADGTAQGWVGFNSTASVSEEHVFGAGKHALKVTPGQWGACPKIEGADFSGCKVLKFQLWCEADGKSPKAWPQLWVNGQNTGVWVGPNADGSVDHGKWQECTVKVGGFANINSLMFQVWGVSAVYVGQVWADAVPVRKVP